MQTTEEMPSSARVWLVTCIFYILITSGVTLLILSMVLSTPGSTILLPTIGMILVGIPWAFWFMTCFYRTMKGCMQQPTAPPANSANSGTASKETSNINEESGDERPLAKSTS